MVASTTLKHVVGRLITQRMFTKAATKHKLGWEEGFRWRGHEVTRIEGLADSVFGLAVTLLVISTEVPHSFNDLVKSLWGFIPFAACFTSLMIVWFEHFKFYRRYNLQDHHTTVMSLVLLCIVLFYVYPLKFMFSSMMMPDQYVVGPSDLGHLFTIYGTGFVAVFFVFFLMYRRALNKSDELGLSEIEIWDTKHSIRETYLNCGVGLISIAIANYVPYPWVVVAGPSYALVGIGAWWHGAWSGKRREAIHAKMFAATVE